MARWVENVGCGKRGLEMARLTVAIALALCFLGACEQKDVCELSTSSASLSCLSFGKKSDWDIQECAKAEREAWEECSKVEGGRDHYCSRMSDRDTRCRGSR
jgi:hypothetical protein